MDFKNAKKIILNEKREPFRAPLKFIFTSVWGKDTYIDKGKDRDKD